MLEYCVLSLVLGLPKGREGPKSAVMVKGGHGLNGPTSCHIIVWKMEAKV